MRGLILVIAVAFAGLALYLHGDGGTGRNRRGGRVERDEAVAGRAGAARDVAPDGAAAEGGALRADPWPSGGDAWRVRFVGRDGGTVFPRGLSRKHGQERLRVARDDEGWYQLPPRPTTLVYRSREFAITGIETTIRLDDFIPFDLALVDPDDGRVLITMSSHVDLEAGLDDHVLALEGRVVEPWRTGAHLSREAARVRGIARAWKEADVRVRVSGPDGAETGATVECAFFGGQLTTEHGELGFDAGPSGYRLPGIRGISDDAGLMRVRGVPAIDGELLKLAVSNDDRWGAVTVRLRRGAIARADVVLEEELVWIPFEEETSGAIGIASDSGWRAEYGTLTVQAYRNDGRPAANAGISLHCSSRRYFARTDERGAATFPKVMVATYVVALKEPGILYTDVVQPIRKGVEHKVTLTEPAGWSFELRVVDDRGLPVPYAAVHVSPAGRMGYVRVVDGVQWVDHLTDRQGALRVGPLPPGDAGIRVRYGTRSASATVKPSQPYAQLRLRPAH